MIISQNIKINDIRLQFLQSKLSTEIKLKCLDVLRIFEKKKSNCLTDKYSSPQYELSFSSNQGLRCLGCASINFAHFDF